MQRLALVVAILLFLCSCERQQQPSSSVRWLWSQQADDGGWHSETYGLLRSGQSLTPFVLLALLEADGDADTARVDRALRFIDKHTAADGSLGRVDESSQDYPNYATSLAVRAIVKARRPGWQDRIAPMICYLRSQQFREENGWHPRDAPYGAWGMGGEPLRPPHTGHVDLSMTRHVLQALRDGGVGEEDPALRRAAMYLKKLQNPDGGFVFSTTEEDTNKAGCPSPGTCRSYGTATADGILAQMAVGEDTGAAWKWLTAHQRDPKRIAGFEGPAYERWHQGLAYYYGAALAEVAFVANRPAPAWDLPSHPAGGKHANAENLVKEDDPLIATGFALRQQFFLSRSPRARR
jgi:prenyltransferase beta subunit